MKDDKRNRKTQNHTAASKTHTEGHQQSSSLLVKQMMIEVCQKVQMQSAEEKFEPVRYGAGLDQFPERDGAMENARV